MKTCPSCGKGIGENTNFCPFCGAPCAQEKAEDQQQENAGEGVFYESAPVNQGQPGASKGFTIAGLVLGIVAIVFIFIPGVSFLGWICSIVGIILSAVAISQSKKAGEKNSMAVAGLVLSIIAIVIGVIAAMVACIAGCAIAGTAGLLN